MSWVANGHKKNILVQDDIWDTFDIFNNRFARSGTTLLELIAVSKLSLTQDISSTYKSTILSNFWHIIYSKTQKRWNNWIAWANKLKLLFPLNYHTPTLQQKQENFLYRI